MKPSDLPRFYRAALTYHPEIGTFRGGRGAWRVHHCFEIVEDLPFHDVELPIRVWPVEEHQDGEATKMLYMDVPRMLKDHTFVNPTKLMRAMFVQQRIRRMNATYFPEMYP